MFQFPHTPRVGENDKIFDKKMLKFGIFGMENKKISNFKQKIRQWVLE